MGNIPAAINTLEQYLSVFNTQEWLLQKEEGLPSRIKNIIIEQRTQQHQIYDAIFLTELIDPTLFCPNAKDDPVGKLKEVIEAILQILTSNAPVINSSTAKESKETSAKKKKMKTFIEGHLKEFEKKHGKKKSTSTESVELQTTTSSGTTPFGTRENLVGNALGSIVDIIKKVLFKFIEELHPEVDIIHIALTILKSLFGEWKMPPKKKKKIPEKLSITDGDGDDGDGDGDDGDADYDTEVEQPEDYLYDLFDSIVSKNHYKLSGEYAKIPGNSKSYGNYTSNARHGFLWNCDKIFGQWRREGCNPYAIKGFSKEFSFEEQLKDLGFLKEDLLKISKYIKYKRYVVGKDDDKSWRKNFYYEDFRILEGVQDARKDYMLYSPVVVFYQNPTNHDLLPIAIKLDKSSLIYIPYDRHWYIAKLYANSAWGNFHESVQHLLLNHYVSESIEIVTMKNLKSGKVFDLLASHFYYTGYVNDLARKTLANPNGSGVFQENFSIGSKGVYNLAKKYWKKYDHRKYIIKDGRYNYLEENNLKGLRKFPWKKDSAAMYTVIKMAVDEYFKGYKFTSAEKKWYEIQLHEEGNFPNIEKEFSRRAIREFITFAIFNTSGGHAGVNFPQFKTFANQLFFPFGMRSKCPSAQQWKDCTKKSTHILSWDEQDDLLKTYLPPKGDAFLGTLVVSVLCVNIVDPWLSNGKVSVNFLRSQSSGILERVDYVDKYVTATSEFISGLSWLTWLLLPWLFFLSFFLGIWKYFIWLFNYLFRDYLENDVRANMTKRLNLIEEGLKGRHTYTYLKPSNIPTSVSI